MKKITKFVSLLFSVSLLGTSSACRLQIDTGEQALPSLSLSEVVRYRAAWCQETLAQNLDKLGAQQAFHRSYAQKFSERAATFGPRWPRTTTASNPTPALASPSPAASQVPEPIPFSDSLSTSQISAQWSQCAQQQLDDAYQLAKLLYQSPTSPIPELGKEKITELYSLVESLFAAGVAAQTEFTSWAQQVHPASSSSVNKAAPASPLIWQSEQKKWETDQSALRRLQQLKGTSSRQKEMQQTLQSALIQLDSLRYYYELQAAHSKDWKHKEDISDTLVPLLLSESQLVISQLGNDPRQGTYQFDFSPTQAARPETELLSELVSLQYQFLSNSPDPNALKLAQTMQQLLARQAKLRQPQTALPGLEARSASVNAAG